jgi:GMP synthase-like glutamine amidotransferase
MHIHVIQHVPFEGPGSIADWAARNSHAISIAKMFAQDPFPVLDAIDWLVVMGGPMGIHDETDFPWLAEEKLFIRKAVEERKILIGICLGAQLLADALNASVYANRHKEIGWFPVTFSEDALRLKLFHFFGKEEEVFHWHGDTFDLPSGATLLAESAGCANQAFVWEERIFGFQFHLEITGRGAAGLVEHCGNDITQGEYIQRPEEMLSDAARFKRINRLMDNFLTNLSESESFMKYSD